MSGLTQLIRSFAPRLGTDTSGNVTILFGLSVIVLVGLTGLGIDYGIALADKTKLDNAADAAAVAAVATAKAYIAANPNDTNQAANAIAAGQDRALRSFAVNAGSISFAQIPVPSVNLTRSGQNFKATVSYTTTAQNHFGQIFGSPTMSVSGLAAAASGVPSYIDFYLLIDVSGSMGLPSTADGQTQLAKLNNDMYSDYQQGCQFACHFPGYTGYNLAVSNNIQLRSGAVNSAVCSLLNRAASPSVPNQYRIGIYPFINQMATLAALSNNYSNLSTIAQCSSKSPLAFTQLLDTGSTQLPIGGDPTTGTGSGGTHFEVTFPQMLSKISKFGDGSSATKSKPYVFLVTDGMENFQHFFTMKNGKYAYPGSPSTYAGYSDAWWDGSQPASIDPTLCQSMKSAGVTISILYIPYLYIPYTPNGGTIASENAKVNAFNSSLAPALKSCASDGFFYTANTPADITASMNAMFNQAVQVTHLSQ